MKKIRQCVEEFFAPGTLGSKNGEKTLENVILRMNNEGWGVDQIAPLEFRPSQFLGGVEMARGILLCTKIE